MVRNCVLEHMPEFWHSFNLSFRKQRFLILTVLLSEFEVDFKVVHRIEVEHVFVFRFLLCLFKHLSEVRVELSETKQFLKLNLVIRDGCHAFHVTNYTTLR